MLLNEGLIKVLYFLSFEKQDLALLLNKGLIKVLYISSESTNQKCVQNMGTSQVGEPFVKVYIEQVDPSLFSKVNLSQ